MLFRQVIHEDLGCASYLVGDARARIAAVVDPQWDIEPYLRLARLHGVRIEHVLETHNHADHVSGHGRLARATGAAIHIHELAEVDYEHEPFADRWRLELGEVVIEAAHTPGHRPEHTAFVIRDEARGDDPVAVLSGDSLFVGDVARPDLAVEPAEGAADLYRSLRDRLFSLPPSAELWPGHLGGSMCGSSALDHKSSSTIGTELARNRAAGFESEQEFVADATSSLGARPPHAEHVVALNRGPLIDRLGAPARMSPRAVAGAISDGAVLVDARTNEQFDEAHVPGAISANAGDTGFATKVAQVVEPDTELIVVAGSDEYELAAAELLGAVGLTVSGFLAGGMTAWRSEDRAVERVPTTTAAQLGDPELEATLVLDVRNEDEYARGHVEGALNIPYAELLDRLSELPRNRPIATLCSGGKRSGLAASILQREGFEQVIHVTDGIR